VRKVKVLMRSLFLLSLIGISFFACKTVEVARDVTLKPLNTDRLIKRIEENVLDYKYFTIKRITCRYRDKMSKSTFRANLIAQKDKKIILSFNKLNIPVGRILLMPDSVKYINYLDKSYYVGDYSFLYKMFNIEIDFYDVQSILSNNVFSYRNSQADKDFRNFTTYTDSGRYVLQSVNNRKLNKIEQKDKSQKIERILKRFGDEAFILQTLFIHPGDYNIEKVEIEDRSNNQKVEIEFDDYKALKSIDYPGIINMVYISGEERLSMEIKIAGISTDETSSFRFNIPSKYERFELN